MSVTISQSPSLILEWATPDDRNATEAILNLFDSNLKNEPNLFGFNFKISQIPQRKPFQGAAQSGHGAAFIQCFRTRICEINVQLFMLDHGSKKLKEYLPQKILKFLVNLSLLYLLLQKNLTLKHDLIWNRQLFSMYDLSDQHVTENRGLFMSGNINVFESLCMYSINREKQNMSQLGIAHKAGQRFNILLFIDGYWKHIAIIPRKL